MKTLDRYITGIFLKHLITAICAMSILFTFQAMFPDLYDPRYPIQQIFTYHGMNFPQVIIQMTPPAVLLATLLTLSGLNRTQELIACYSIGLSLKQLLRWTAISIGITSCLALIVEDRILPPLFKMRTNYYWKIMKKKPDFFLDIKRQKIWYRSKNMIYNLQYFDAPSQTIHGMSIYTFDENFNLIQSIEAERAQYIDQVWKLKNGNTTTFSVETLFPITQNFQEKMILIDETPQHFQEISKEANGLKLIELYEYIQKIRQTGEDTKPYEVHFHSRINLSFISIVMFFLAIPFSLTQKRSGGVAKDLGVCLLITFFYWIIYSIGLSLGTNGSLEPWLAAWLPSLIFMTLAIFFMMKKSNRFGAILRQFE